MRTRVVLECSECGSRNYTTSKDRAKQPDRLEQRKFCRRCNAHTLHRETR
ncbi:50S ribosomal protein L33 [bacterium]|nr:50S ribosomal protein L33 [bacterium]